MQESLTFKAGQLGGFQVQYFDKKEFISTPIYSVGSCLKNWSLLKTY